MPSTGSSTNWRPVSARLVVAVHRAIKKYNDEAADAAIKGFAEAAKGMA